MKNSQLIYLKKPDNNFPQNVESIFEIREQIISIKNIEEGQYLVQVQHVSIDPVMRVWLSGAQTYFPALKSGDIMHCFGVGRVIFSKNTNFEVGSKVFGNLGIQSYSIIDKQRSKTVSVLPDSSDYPSIQLKDYLALVNNGMAAYMGLIEICKPKPTDTVLVSTAAGATGLLVCQLAKQIGCKIIGMTGSEKKVNFLKNELKIDEVINYKKENIADVLNKKRIDIYFDNVGEKTLDLAIKSMNNHGRIALCGAIDNYNDYNNRKGIQNIMQIVLKRILMRGFTFAELGLRIPEILEFYFEQIQKGVVKLYYEEFNGIQQISKAMKFCFEGNNIGKVIIQINNLSFEQACEQIVLNINNTNL